MGDLNQIYWVYGMARLEDTQRCIFLQVVIQVKKRQKKWIRRQNKHRKER